jgi:hypothetical protein
MDNFDIHEFFHNHKIDKSGDRSPIHKITQILGYDSIDQFFNENKGAFSSTVSWIMGNPDFREKLSELKPEDLAKLGLDSRVLEAYSLDFE